MRRFAFIVFAAVPISLSAEAEPLALGRFSAGDTEGWQVREFEGETRYRIVELDGRKVLEADSVATASSFYLERKVDLSETPVLEWSWRIESPPGVTDERSKDGDDFAARVYVLAPGEGIFGLPWAISYVWAGQARVGEFWPNPFTSRVMMFALDSGKGAAGTWRTHKRDVRADFLRFFGRRVDRLEGVAIMTDSDNSGLNARAWYGDLAFRRD
ncbi:MAG: DUF3047 domain-containing protein [Defluviicoccus sp.]|nr:DUF3047 domain-containing protein [Defluviicoccus sp.]